MNNKEGLITSGRILLALALIVMLSITGICTASQVNIKTGTWIACVDKEDTKTLYGYLADGDTAAFQKAGLPLLLEGKATLFKDEEPIYLEDVSMWEGLDKVRRAGETQSYWIPNKAINIGS